MHCKDIRAQLNAYLDGELDAGAAPALEAHVATCALCGAELRSLRQLQHSIRTEGHWPLPNGLEASLRQTLHSAAETEQMAQGKAALLGDWRGILVGLAAGLVLGVVFYLLLMQPVREGNGLVDRVVALHVQSQLADHLVDVASSDRHQVKPWFQGRVDYSVPVHNLADQGFPLLGGRIDYLDGRNVAALVFGHRRHRINLFVWPATESAARIPETTNRRGYRLIARAAQGLEFLAVSDLNGEELEHFLRLYLEYGT